LRRGCNRAPFDEGLCTIGVNNNLGEGDNVMRAMKSFAGVILCLTILAGLWSCQTPAGRSAGQVVDDTTIVTKSKALLLDDPQVSGLAINVEAFEGTVTLIGRVNNQAEKTRAENIVKSVKGVHRVNNLLKVGQ
jgi:hyperosmotically inducible protein